MSVARAITEEDRQMLDLLHELGLEEQARQYEGLLRGELPSEREPTSPSAPILGAVPVAEAAVRLGLSPKEAHRHVALGLLKAESDPAAGEYLITNASIAWLLEARHDLATIVPFPWEADEPIDPDSLLGQMLAANRRDEEDDGEAWRRRDRLARFRAPRPLRRETTISVSVPIVSRSSWSTRMRSSRSHTGNRWPQAPGPVISSSIGRGPPKRRSSESPGVGLWPPWNAVSGSAIRRSGKWPSRTHFTRCVPTSMPRSRRFAGPSGSPPTWLPPTPRCSPRCPIRTTVCTSLRRKPAALPIS